MDLQNILTIIQTILCALSLLISLFTLNQVKIVKKNIVCKKNKNYKNSQISIGKRNKQKIEK